MFRVSFAFNDSYILEFWVEYSRILLIRITYMNVKWAASMRVLRLNSLKHFMNLPGYVQGWNEHNYKNWKMSEKKLCEFYCLGIYKWLNSLRHLVHWLANISDDFHKGKFKATSYFFRYSNFSSTLSVSTSSFALCFINFYSCGGLLEK